MKKLIVVREGHLGAGRCLIESDRIALEQLAKKIKSLPAVRRGRVKIFSSPLVASNKSATILSSTLGLGFEMNVVIDDFHDSLEVVEWLREVKVDADVIILVVDLDQTVEIPDSFSASEWGLFADVDVIGVGEAMVLDCRLKNITTLSALVATK